MLFNSQYIKIYNYITPLSFRTSTSSSNGNIPIKEIDSSYILVDFYGSEKELNDYLSLLHNNFKGDSNEILVKSNFYLPKEKNPTYFCKILYQLKIRLY